LENTLKLSPLNVGQFSLAEDILEI